MSIDTTTTFTADAERTPAATTGSRGRSSRRAAWGALGAAGTLAVIGVAGTPAHAAETGDATLEAIKACESGGDYTAVNPTSGASGAYQFLDSTWATTAAGAGYASAADAPESVQDAAALELYAEQGTTPWNASQACWSDAAGVAAMTTATSQTTVSDEVVTGAATAEAQAAPVERTVQVTGTADAPAEATADARAEGTADTRAEGTDGADRAGAPSASSRADRQVGDRGVTDRAC